VAVREPFAVRHTLPRGTRRAQYPGLARSVPLREPRGSCECRRRTPVSWGRATRSARAKSTSASAERHSAVPATGCEAVRAAPPPPAWRGESRPHTGRERRPLWPQHQRCPCSEQDRARPSRRKDARSNSATRTVCRPTRSWPCSTRPACWRSCSPGSASPSRRARPAPRSTSPRATSSQPSEGDLRVPLLLSDQRKEWT